MVKYKVLSDTLSGMYRGCYFVKGEEIGAECYGSELTNSLIERGFLEEIVIVEVIEDEIDYNSYTVAKLKEMIIELGAEPVDGLKADLIEQIKGLV
jgi:hypothetical protein